MCPNRIGALVVQNTKAKSVITYDDAHPDGENLAPLEEDWDGRRQVVEADVSDLYTMCAWVGEDKGSKGSYKLPHHRASDKNTVWKGVAAAMSALLGGRGGVDMPDSDKKGVYNHLADHYREFDKEPPEFKSISSSALPHYSSSEFRSEMEGKTHPSVVVKSYESSVAKSTAHGERVLTFTISTGDVDRDNDTVAVNGWDLKNFNKSGSILWAHNPDLPPVAKPIKTWLSTIKGARALRSTAQFAPEDMPHPYGVGFGHTVYRMYEEGYMRAVSVGFIPREWNLSEERNTGGRSGTDFRKQELLEFSCVPVPSNPSALVEVQGKGIDISPLGNWAEAALDLDKPIHCVSREDIETVYQIAKGSPVSISMPGNFEFEFQKSEGGDSMDTDDSVGEIVEKEKEEMIEKAIEDIEARAVQAPSLGEANHDEFLDTLTRDEWARLVIGLSRVGDEKGFEFTVTETKKVSFVNPASLVLDSIGQTKSDSGLKEKTVCNGADSDSDPDTDDDVVIGDVEEFRKSILEAVHNQFVLPVTGKLY